MTDPKRVLITGITGQDGSYLCELLLEQGYEVHGIIRRTSTFNTDRIDHIYEDPHAEGAQLFLHYGDLTDGTTLRRILEDVKPVEIYNLGAQSHVRVSFDSPEYTADSVEMGILRLLEAIRDYQKRGDRQLPVFGDGSPTREFLYSEDAARGIVMATQSYSDPEPVNLGTGKEITIRDLITLICDLMEFKGEIVWQTDQPNGQPRRCLDTDRAKAAFGFEAQVGFEEGLRTTINWYRQNQ